MGVDSLGGDGRSGALARHGCAGGQRGGAAVSPTASFDAVFSNAALHWVRDQDAMMAEVHRVLKPRRALCGRDGRARQHRGDSRGVDGGAGAAWLWRSRRRRELLSHAGRLYTAACSVTAFKVEQMALIPRPTPLAESGMAGWLRTFRRGVLESLPKRCANGGGGDGCAACARAAR